MITRPMLAFNGSLPPLEELPYPMLATPKIDGIRAIKLHGRLLSRNFKPIPNDYVRHLIETSPLPNGMDGELVCPGGFQATTSAIMSHNGTPPFVWRVFDYVAVSDLTAYENRMHDLRQWFHVHSPSSGYIGYADPVLPDVIESVDDLLEFEKICLEEGYEGVMLRHPRGPYKSGRSTLKEAYLLKLKRFEDSEAVVLDVEEEYTNGNPKDTNELGLAERSSARAGMIPKGTLGSLFVEDVTTKRQFNIGSGFTQPQREGLWACRHDLIGKIVKYKFQPSGVKDLPRFPVFLGLRKD